MRRDDTAADVPPRAGILGLAIGLALLLVLGYLVFVFFVSAFSPSPGWFSLLALAVVAGVAAFFNPCAFPLLPGYLAHLVQRANEAPRQTPGRLLYGGAFAALGLSTFNLLLGGLLALLGAAFLGSLTLASPDPNPYVQVFRGLIGTLVLALGLSHLSGRGLSFGFLEGLGRPFRLLSGRSPTRDLYVYGLGYNALGVGCGGPILAGLSVFALAFGGFQAVLLAFLLFALTMGALLIVVSLLPAFASPRSLGRLGRSTVKVQRSAGLVQAAVGGLLVASSIYPALFLAPLVPM